YQGNTGRASPRLPYPCTAEGAAPTNRLILHPGGWWVRPARAHPALSAITDTMPPSGAPLLTKWLLCGPAQGSAMHPWPVRVWYLFPMPLTRQSYPAVPLDGPVAYPSHRGFHILPVSRIFR